MATAITSGGDQVLAPGHGGHDDAHDDHDHGHYTSMGLNSVKFLMWSFIASECMLFGTLIAAFLAVPIVNLLTPLFAAGLMVHLHKALSRKDRDFSLRQN